MEAEMRAPGLVDHERHARVVADARAAGDVRDHPVVRRRHDEHDPGVRLLVEHPPERLREVEFAPFRAAIAAGVACIMTAHVLVPSIDETRPPTLSPRVVRALLREELGYDGVILSDDLEMKAIAAAYDIPDAAVQAIAAGCDGLLICSGNVDAQAATLEALVYAVEDGRIPWKRFEDALTRQRRAKERFLAAPVSADKNSKLRHVLGCDQHQRVAEEMSRYL